MFSTILLIAALVCALLAALWRPPAPTPPYWPHLGWLAIALYLLSLVLAAAH
jgi:hypothetical protein